MQKRESLESAKELQKELDLWRWVPGNCLAVR